MGKGTITHDFMQSERRHAGPVSHASPACLHAYMACFCRDTFLSIIRHHNPKLASKVDVVFALSSAWVMTESDSDFEMLEKRLSDLNPDELILVSMVHLCTFQGKHFDAGHNT